jgi:hypothetical protein
VTVQETLSLRQVARLAGVSRAVPQELQRTSVLGARPLLIDVLVVKAIAAVPSKWLRAGLHRDSPGVDAQAVAGLVRQAREVGLLEDDVFLLADPAGARLCSRVEAAGSIMGAAGAVVVMPLGVWWNEMAGLSEGAPGEVLEELGGPPVSP